LTPLLATFLALDVATFWNNSWATYQHAPYSLTLLMLGLTSAGMFYVAASLAFPRETEDGYNLTEHFWKHRRMIFGMVLAANILKDIPFYWVEMASGVQLDIGYFSVVPFYAALLAAVLLPRGRWAVGMFLFVFAGDVVSLGSDLFVLIKSGPWPLGNAIPGGETPF
jgi:hypothetical protein